MARNMAKSFANMTLLYWEPIVGGSGVTYGRPVEFKGKYIGNMQLGDGSPGSFAFSGGGQRENLVLFYLCEPKVDGFVSWELTLDELEEQGNLDTSPTELESTHRIKTVTTFVMPKAKTVALADQAFIAQVM